MHMSNQQMATILLAINTIDNKYSTNDKKVRYGFQYKQGKGPIGKIEEMLVKIKSLPLNL